MMSILGNLIKGASKIAENKKNKNQLNQGDADQQQLRTLTDLLGKAQNTEFGTTYDFEDILKSDDPRQEFRNRVPIFQYDYMFQKFWHKTLNGVKDVSWPGKISNFALTSGTTNSASKRIPVSEEMIKGIKKTCLNQILTLNKMDLPSNFYSKKVLCVGGSTALSQIRDQKEGDLSGILTGRVSSWLNPFTKPNKKIRAIEDWEEKLEEIVRNAPKWDIGIICGVPSWILVLIKRINEYYETDDIFSIWPNLKFYIHGGVSFDPYISNFNSLFDERVVYLDTYLASEGFIAYQPCDSDGLELILNNGIYYEFIPFNSESFDNDGNLLNYQDSYLLSEIHENVEYALLISTNSGAFRYLIGDTIKFSNLNKLKFKITGRTKHFLSLCGEHLSVDNMTQAITELSIEKGITIDEFAVCGKQTVAENFIHHWYIACDLPINSLNFKYDLDQKLRSLNTDYHIERSFALEDIKVDILPTKIFYDFLKLKDKYGSQHKFPRVLKGKLAKDWCNYLEVLKEELPNDHLSRRF